MQVPLVLRSFPWIESEFARARWMYIVGMAYLLIGYLGTNEIAALNPWDRAALPISTSFDRELPFVPWTVIFYVLYYPLLGTPLLFARDPIALSRLSLAQAGMNTFAYVIFLLFPTPIDRPPSVPVEGWAHVVLDSLYRADHPYNTFPSLHVAQTCLLALFYLRFRPRWIGETLHRHHTRLDFSVILLHGAASILVAASAVLIKQHYVADATAGALLAAAVAWLVFRPAKLPAVVSARS